MDLDATFRPYVVVGFFLVILIALPFRIKSQSTGEKLDRMQEGIYDDRLRLAGLALWVERDRLHDQSGLDGVGVAAAAGLGCAGLASASAWSRRCC